MRRKIFTVCCLLNIYIYLCLPGSVYAQSPFKHPHPDDYIPFSLSISGGVSLGSYEAGLNWAIMKYLRVRHTALKAENKVYPELMSVSGASAGSINALISSLLWCVDENAITIINGETKLDDTIQSNLYSDLWLNIGIDDLLPAVTSKNKKDRKAGYNDSDALLSRAGFEKTIERLKSLLNAKIYRANCQIPMGLTVTRVNPASMNIAGVKVKNQRFMIPIRFESTEDGGLLVVSHIISKADPYLGNVIYLKGEYNESIKRYIISTDDLINAVLTSSAFPIAFGRKDLEYCWTDKSLQDNNTSRNNCPDHTYLHKDEFLDGGVFDNVPLGTAKVLAEQRQYGLKTQPAYRRYNYIYLEPDNRRGINGSIDNHQHKDESSACDKAEQKTYGLGCQLRFLGGAVSTSRYYELYNALRGPDWSNQVYGHACTLQNIVYFKRSNSVMCQPEQLISTHRCLTILNMTTLSTEKDRQSYATCLLNKATELEKFYTATSGNWETGQKHQGKDYNKQRKDLIKKMTVLAESIGENTLAYSISAAAEDELGDRRLLLSRRFPPITGAMLSNFGAFMDRPFREYDYYAGVYDATHGIARYYCERTGKFGLCFSRMLRRVYTDLAIGNDDIANSMFKLFFVNEHPDVDLNDKQWQWINRPGAIAGQLPPNYLSIFNALTDDQQLINDTFYKDPKFDKFAKALFQKRPKYDTSKSSYFLKSVERLQDEEPSYWYYPLTERITDRLLELEGKESENIENGMTQTLLRFGSLTINSIIENKDDTLVHRTASPKIEYSLLPYEIGVDVKNGGPVVAWHYGVPFGKNLSFDLRFTPVHHNRFADNEIWFSQIDSFISWRSDNLVSSMGIGPTYTYTYKVWPGSRQENFGASLYLGFFRDKIRFSIGQRTDGNHYTSFAGDSSFWYLSVTDIPGIYYWLTR